MKRNILIWPDPVLERKSEAITTVTSDVQQLLSDMAETMEAAKGAGLAAPQVGFNLRAIVVKVKFTPKDAPAHEDVLKLVNPEIVYRSEQRIKSDEGCLSLPGVIETVWRANEVEVAALDETGQPVKLRTDGFLAIVLQHEIEHLDGITLPAHMKPLKLKMTREKLVKAKKRGLRYNFDGPPPRDFTGS